MDKDLRKAVQTIVILLLIGGVIWLAGRRGKRSPAIENSGYRMMMGTYAQISITEEDPAKARGFFNAAFEKMEKVNTLMNDRDPDSEISQLSETAWKEPVPVSRELFDVLNASLNYSRLSDGAFDITVGPEVRLWRRMKETGQKPTSEQLTQARERVGYQKLILNEDDQSVRMEREGMYLDVGAIAKGYAVDLAVQVLIDAGVSAGMVDLGGNIRCFGVLPEYPDGWLIGVQDPMQDGKLLTRIVLRNRAVATSGGYRRYAEIDGKKQSHILNPSSGVSVGQLASVTIIAPTGMEADALSTAVSVMGKEKGLALIESISDVEAILVTAENSDELAFSSGAEAYLRLN